MQGDTCYMPLISTHRENPVDNLVRTKHLEKITPLPGHGQPSATDSRESQDALDIFLVELHNMDLEALNALYKEEKEKDRIAKPL